MIGKLQVTGYRLQVTGIRWLLLVVFLVLFLAACGDGGEDPEVAALKETLTYVAESGTVMEPAPATPESPSSEPPPPEETAPEEVPSEAPPAEEPPVDIAATETAVSVKQTVDAVNAAATETAIVLEGTLEPIRAELISYGVDPNQGNLGFTHPPISIEEDEFEQFEWRNQNLFTVARDFVIAADITWNSEFAESGCGFAVRSDGEEENLNQYLIGLTRGAQGHVLFAEQVNGDVDLNLVTDIYGGKDPQFEWQNDTTNRIAVVGRGQDFTIYSNGTNIGTISGQAGFEEGFVAFFALNRSGGVRCDFNNAWLWRMN